MIALDSADSIPRDLAKAIKPLHAELRQARFIDSVARSATARSILTLLTEYLEETGVIGVHYTRAEQSEIAVGGLQCKTGAERRAWFLKSYDHHFSTAEQQAIERAWCGYFSPDQNAARDSRIWFNFTASALDDGGATPLLEHFGGETIYMPLVECGTIVEKIRSFGAPLIVKCRLRPSQLVGFWEFPAALVWLSAYHVKLNPSAGLYDVEVYATASIPACDIVSIQFPRGWLR